MLPQLGHLINAPDAIDVMRIATLQLGHETSYSFDSRTCSLGPLTIDGMSAIAESWLIVHNVKLTGRGPES